MAHVHGRCLLAHPPLRAARRALTSHLWPIAIALAVRIRRRCAVDAGVLRPAWLAMATAAVGMSSTALARDAIPTLRLEPASTAQEEGPCGCQPSSLRQSCHAPESRRSHSTAIAGCRSSSVSRSRLALVVRHRAARHHSVRHGLRSTAIDQMALTPPACARPGSACICSSRCLAADLQSRSPSKSVCRWSSHFLPQLSPSSTPDAVQRTQRARSPNAPRSAVVHPLPFLASRSAASALCAPRRCGASATTL